MSDATDKNGRTFEKVSLPLKPISPPDQGPGKVTMAGPGIPGFIMNTRIRVSFQGAIYVVTNYSIYRVWDLTHVEAVQIGVHCYWLMEHNGQLLAGNDWDIWQVA